MITEDKTLTRSDINPEALRRFRKSAHLSQQGLADLSFVSKKTIARIEGGKSSANASTITSLAVALGVRSEDLSGQSDPLEEDEINRKARRVGFRNLKTPIHENTDLAFQMVEKRYGISTRTQISLAPLFAALLAEGSLAWRNQKLEQAGWALDALVRADYGHRMFVVDGAIAEDGLIAEQDSILEGDIFGEATMEIAADFDPDPTDPFTEYLRHLADEFDAEHINVIQEYLDDEFDLWGTSIRMSDWSSLGFSIDPEELEWLVGDDMRARLALQRGYVKIADIPESLMGNDVSMERIAWLGSKMPQAEFEEAEAEDEEFMAYLMRTESLDGEDTPF